MVEASGRVRWGAANGLRIYEIRHPLVDAPLAVTESPFKGTARYRPEPGETEAQFITRISAHARNRGEIHTLKLFLPVWKRQLVRVRLD